MPLTKVRYDMLDAEVTTKITQNVSLSGAGSPFVFTPNQDNTVSTLTDFKVDGVNKKIRRTEFASDKLVITLASFTPTVTVTGQSLKWDQRATEFTVGVDNPVADFPSQWISDVDSIAQKSGDITTDLAKFTVSQATLPTTASSDYTAKYTVTQDGYIRPVVTPTGGVYPNTGGSASAEVTVKSTTEGAPPTTSNWGTKYTWTTNWENAARTVAITALSGKTFLKEYDSTTYTITTTGLHDTSNVNHTITGTNGNASNGTLTFTKKINKDFKSEETKVTVKSDFYRPQEVTGTAYTHTPADLDSTNVATGAEFSYPSITLFTAAGGTPALNDIIDDNADTGFGNSVTVLGHQVNTFAKQAVVNNTANTRVFWFGVRSSVTQPTQFLTGGGTLMSPYSKATATLNLKPDNTNNFQGNYSAVPYTFYGFNISANSTLFIEIA